MKKTGLRRELGLLPTTMMGIGGAIQAGIFVMLGHAIGLVGTAVLIALLLCGIINLFTMCSYAELGAALPTAGGEYTFSKIAYGGFISFLTGWFEWISNMFFAALSAVGFAYIISSYILSYIAPVSFFTVPLIALFIIAVFTVVNIKGVKEVGTSQVVMIVALLVILMLYIWSGFSSAQMKPLQMPASTNPLGIIQATAYIFVVYLGAEAIAVAQAEVKEPGKTIPRAILLTGAALIVIYILIAFVTLSLVPVETLGGEASPIIFAARQIMGDIGMVLLVVAGTIAALSSVNTAIMAQSRVAYALSRDGYFPKALLKIHGRFATPHVAVVVGAIFTGVLAATGVINFVGYATDFGFIIGFTLVNLSLIKLRREKPLLERPFKVPFYPYTPILGIATSLFLLIFIEAGVLVLGTELVLVAVLAYYIRMVGYHRIRVAFGGISLSLGGFTALAACLIGTNAIKLGGVDPPTTTAILVILLLVSTIQILAGILNVTAKPKPPLKPWAPPPPRRGYKR